MKQWYILERDGTAMKKEDLPKRPSEAHPEDGEAFRPWFKEHEHIHVEGGRIEGVHAFGELEELKQELARILEHEEELINHFGGEEDIRRTEAEVFLNKEKD